MKDGVLSIVENTACLFAPPGSVYSNIFNNEDMFAGFVKKELAERKLEINGDFRKNDPVDMFLCGRVFLLSVMTGIDPVFEQFNGRLLYVTRERPETLRLLRCRGTDHYFWSDSRLFEISEECRKRARFGFPSYKQSIDELGQSGEVVGYFGHAVSYEDWVKYTGPKVHSEGPDFRQPSILCRNSTVRRINKKNHYD